MVAVVPAYMAAGTLDATLAAIAEQAVVARVVVVVSPGDDTATVAHLSASSSPVPIEILEAPRRLSAGAARNAGLGAAAEARYVLFVDADCRVLPGAVAQLRDAVASGRADVAVARLTNDCRSVVARVRHALEFKEAEVAGSDTELETAPSAVMLTRPATVTDAGGFPDFWPGEDLVLCHRWRERSVVIARIGAAHASHRHPRGLGEMFAHQARLGSTSARARRCTGMRGALFVRRPYLVPALFVGRLLRGVAWFVRYKPSELPWLIAVSPVYAAALAVWCYGFWSEATRRPAEPRETGEFAAECP